MPKALFSIETAQGKFATYLKKPFAAAEVHQTHSHLIAPHPSPLDTKADGLYMPYTTAAAIKTADCLPLLLLGSTHYCLIHAGWRGLAHGILNHSLAQKCQPQFFLIGPHIQKCCYEVSHEFKQHFLQSSSFFEKKQKKLYFDLTAEARRQMKQNYKQCQELDAEVPCTFCHSQFYSYRRNATTGRNWNIFTPNL